MLAVLLMIAGSVLLMIAGSVLFFHATLVLLRANPHSKIPAWIGNPPVVPDRVIACRVLGVVLLIFGAQVSTSAWYWASALIVVLMIPSLVCMVLHNRRVARAVDTRPTE